MAFSQFYTTEHLILNAVSAKDMLFILMDYLAPLLLLPVNRLGP